MNWIKLTERKPQRCERVLIRYEDKFVDKLKIHYDVAQQDAGLWWLDARHALSKQYDNVTHWAKIEPPTKDTEIAAGRIAELETKLRTLEQFYSHTFAGTGVTRCAHCGSEGDSAEWPAEHVLTCPYYGLPAIDLDTEITAKKKEVEL